MSLTVFPKWEKALYQACSDGRRTPSPPKPPLEGEGLLRADYLPPLIILETIPLSVVFSPIKTPERCVATNRATKHPQ